MDIAQESTRGTCTRCASQLPFRPWTSNGKGAQRRCVPFVNLTSGNLSCFPNARSLRVNRPWYWTSVFSPSASASMVGRKSPFLERRGSASSLAMSMWRLIASCVVIKSTTLPSEPLTSLPSKRFFEGMFRLSQYSHFGTLTLSSITCAST